MTLVIRTVDRGVTYALRQLVDFVLDRVDLTQIVLDRVDLARIVRAIDLNEAAARIDIDAILARVDLVGTAESVINAIDLPAIIRGSTTSMTTEGIAGLRMQGAAADARLDHLMDRVLLRRRHGVVLPAVTAGDLDGGQDAAT